VAGAGNGFVDEFSLSGKLIARVASNGRLIVSSFAGVLPDIGRLSMASFLRYGD
jgi:hypothetical protein